MAKKLFKKGLSALLATLMCFGTMSTMASAEGTHNGTHLLGDAEGDLKTFNFKVEDGYKPAADEEGYAVVGAGEQTEFWTAYLIKDSAGELKINDERYAYVDNAKQINGIYLDGAFYPADSDKIDYPGKGDGKKLLANYNGLQQALLMNNAGKKVAVYCADHVTPTTTEALYEVVNIEDAKHYNEYTAGKIRAVAVNGYWGGTEEVDQYGTLAKMKAMMKASGKFTDAEIALLSPGVALSATQFAIWELANKNDDRQVVNVQYIQKDRVAGYNGKTWNTLKLTPKDEIPCVDLIFKLSNYLVNLPGIPASEMSTANTVLNYKNILQDVEIEVLKKAAGHKNNADANKDNDAFVTNVTFDMLQVSDKDSLVAKIVDEAGNVYATGRIAGAKQAGEVALKNNGDGTYTFRKVTLIENKETTYTVVVEGVQYLERNVYLYFAGDRETSQTLIGYDEGEFTVDVTSSVKKIFNVDYTDIVIHKVDEQGKAVTGAKFALYAVTEDGDKLIGEYKVDKCGEISIRNLEAGTYKLVETVAPKGYIGVAEPMYFEVVATEDGKGFEIKHVFDKFQLEFPATAYEISNHITDVAIPQTFVLLDAEDADSWSYTKEYAFGESDYRVVYCGDSDTNVVDGTRYTKTALEECFDTETANQLRAIIANSYPYVSMEEMIAAAEASGVADAANLTRGDIIAAVQLAVWHYTNDIEDYTYKATYSVNNYPQWGKVFHDYSDELPDTLPNGTTARTVDDASDARIRALYNYLLALDPMTAAESEINTFFYTAVDGKDVSQSLIGGDRTDFYADGLNIYVKNFSDKPECPKPEKPECPKPEKPGCGEKPQKPGCGEKPEKPECPKPEKPGCGETDEPTSSIGMKTSEEMKDRDDNRYQIQIEVPGIDGDNKHDEVILMVDGSYSMDNEWPAMKEAINTIGKTVLNGSGNTQLTLMAFGMGDNEVLVHVKDADELAAALGELPGNLLYGRSSTNCEAGFTGVAEYIANHDGTLNKVQVIFISDGNVNTDETPRAFDANWQTWTKFGALTVAQETFGGTVSNGENLHAAFTTVFGNRFAGATNAEILERAFGGEVTDEEFIAFAEQVWTDVYAYSGLTRGTEYPVSDAERAFVKYDKENGTYIQDLFYYTTYKSDYVTYGDRWTRTPAAADALAAMDKVEAMYVVDYDSYTAWMDTGITSVKSTFVQSNGIAGLCEALQGALTDLAKTPFNDVVVTDYMSKWVTLDQTTIKIVDNITGEVIWTITDGWADGVTPTTANNPPVVVELVDPSDYAAGGEDVVHNKSGDIYKLTWYVKDGAMLRSDTYSLQYEVTVDTEEHGFKYDREYPANGNTDLTYTDEYGNKQTGAIEVPTVEAEKSNCGEKPQKPEKPDCGEKPQKPEKPDCGEKPEKPDCNKPEWDDDKDDCDRNDKDDRNDKGDCDRNDKDDRNDKGDCDRNDRDSRR